MCLRGAFCHSIFKKRTATRARSCASYRSFCPLFLWSITKHSNYSRVPFTLDIWIRFCSVNFDFRPSYIRISQAMDHGSWPLSDESRTKSRSED